MAQEAHLSQSLSPGPPHLASLLLHLSPPRTISAAPWAVADGASGPDGAQCLADILLHSQCGIAADLDRRCLLLQLCLALLDAHARGRCHGAVVPANISVAFGALMTLHGPLRPAHSATAGSEAAPPRNAGFKEKTAAQQGRLSATVSSPAVPDLPGLTTQWRQRRVSNLEYVLQLNALAGRSGADLDNLPLVPWVIDFTCDPRPGLAHKCVPMPVCTCVRAGAGAMLVAQHLVSKYTS